MIYHVKVNKKRGLKRGLFVNVHKIDCFEN
jgi:hypothetical protein